MLRGRKVHVHAPCRPQEIQRVSRISTLTDSSAHFQQQTVVVKSGRTVHPEPLSVKTLSIYSTSTHMLLTTCITVYITKAPVNID